MNTTKPRLIEVLTDADCINLENADRAIAEHLVIADRRDPEKASVPLMTIRDANAICFRNITFTYPKTTALLIDNCQNLSITELAMNYWNFDFSRWTQPVHAVVVMKSNGVRLAGDIDCAPEEALMISRSYRVDWDGALHGRPSDTERPQNCVLVFAHKSEVSLRGWATWVGPPGVVASDRGSFIDNQMKTPPRSR